MVALMLLGYALGWLVNMGISWAAAGAGFGAIMWYRSEANYRKLKGRQ
jgi:hypothetical protein